MKKYSILLIVFVIGLKSTYAQIDSNRPTNTVRYQNIHFVVDQVAASVGVDIVELEHNKSLEILMSALQTDIRVKDLHIIMRADNEYVTNLSGIEGQSDLGFFGNWVNDPTNNCDVRDIQSFATGTSGGNADGGGVLAGNAYGGLIGPGFAVHCLYSSPRNDIVLGHEWAHSISALAGNHSQGISFFNATTILDLITTPIYYTNPTTSIGWGFANNSKAFFSTPLNFNTSTLSNGGSGYFAIDLFDDNNNYIAHTDIPVNIMDNANDTAGILSPDILKKEMNWCSIENLENSNSQVKNLVSFTNTTTGIFEHYQNNMDYLRSEAVPDLLTPQISVLNNKINVNNLSDYTIEYPNTTSTTHQSLYHTKGDYQVYVYEVNNTAEGAHIAGPIPLGQIIVDLPTNEYVVRVYEKWSNTLSSVSSSVTLGIDNVEIDDFAIYPNPTTGIINIKSGETLEGMEIYNQLGQLVITKQNVENPISISGLANGIYFVNVTSSKGHKSIRKIIKK